MGENILNNIEIITVTYMTIKIWFRKTTLHMHQRSNFGWVKFTKIANSNIQFSTSYSHKTKIKEECYITQNFDFIGNSIEIHSPWSFEPERVTHLYFRRGLHVSTRQNGASALRRTNDERQRATGSRRSHSRVILLSHWLASSHKFFSLNVLNQPAAGQRTSVWVISSNPLIPVVTWTHEMKIYQTANETLTFCRERSKWKRNNTRDVRSFFLNCFRLLNRSRDYLCQSLVSFFFLLEEKGGGNNQL